MANIDKVKKCKYTKGDSKRLDCLNAYFKKINRPMCANCRPRIKFVPPVKNAEPQTVTAEVAVPESATVSPNDVLTITQEI